MTTQNKTQTQQPNTAFFNAVKISPSKKGEIQYTKMTLIVIAENCHTYDNLQQFIKEVMANNPRIKSIYPLMDRGVLV